MSKKGVIVVDLKIVIRPVKKPRREVMVMPVVGKKCAETKGRTG